MRTRRLVFALASLASAGCAALFGIEDGRYVGADGGDDGGSEASSIPPPPGTDGNPGDDSSADSGADSGCTFIAVSAVADTFLDNAQADAASAGMVPAYGAQTSVTIGTDRAVAIFLFDLDPRVQSALANGDPVDASIVFTVKAKTNVARLRNGAIVIHPARSDWDETDASWLVRYAATDWDEGGASGIADRGVEIGRATLTDLPEGGTEIVPLPNIDNVKSTWLSGTKLTLLAVADQDILDASLKIDVTGHEAAKDPLAPQGPTRLEVMLCPR
jgi:hypothetical protein